MGKHKSVYLKAGDYLHPKFWIMWLLFAFLRITALFPYSFQLKFGRGLGKLIHKFSGQRQHIVDTNLKRCFPEKTATERSHLGQQSIENLGISIMELAMCWWWKPDKLKQLVEVRGMENVQQYLDQKQGVILLSGHMASLEIGARLIALSLPIQVMYRAQRNRLFDSFLFTKRQGYFEDVISRKNTLRLVKGIKKGIPTWYAPDQDFARERNVFAPFFNIPTATITAGSRLAKASGAAVIPFFPERKADGTGYVLWLLPALENFPSGDDVADATAINASIEAFVRKHPEQYMWVHQRFKTRPAGEPKFY